METNSLSEQIKKLRRSPKIGQIYELYRAEMEPVLRSSTMTKLDKVWYAHLSALSDLRADRLSPLEFQHLILQKIYDAGSWYTAGPHLRADDRLCSRSGRAGG